MSEKIGLEAVLEIVQFERNAKSYETKIDLMVSVTRAAAGDISRFGSIMDNAIGTALGNIAGRAIPAVIDGFLDLGSQAIMAAARVEELWLVLGNLAANAGIAQDDMRDAVGAVREYGIRVDVAQKLVAQFMRFQLDLGQATDLARTAQDAAVLSMKDSSEALDLLVQGIVRHETRLIRSAGVVVDAEKAYADYTKELGINSDQLTENMRIQALLNAVIANGATIAGTYETAMLSAGKQIRSWPRMIFDISAAVGEHFMPAFTNLTSVVTDFLRGVDAAIQEGADFYGTLEKLGAIAAVVTEEIADLANVGIRQLFTFAGVFQDNMFDVAEDALFWGASISSNLATGLIQGATTAIVAALDFIGGLITSWLAPGSPPKLLPEIDKWGAALISEWLHGFTEADFDIIQDLQRFMGDAFAGVSGDIIKALSGSLTGAGVSPDIFDAIRQSGALFADDLIDLTQKQLALADAIDAVRLAEERLTQSREEESAANIKVRKLVEEYNEALGEADTDAEKQALEQRYREIKAAEQQAKLAKERRQEAEKNLTVAEKNADGLEEQVKLQRDLLRVLTSLLDREKAAAAKKTGGGAKGVSIPELDIGGYGGDPYDFVRPIDVAFEKLKEKVRRHLEAALEPFRRAWDGPIADSLQRLEKHFNRFNEQALQPLLDKFDWFSIRAMAMGFAFDLLTFDLGEFLKSIDWVSVAITVLGIGLGLINPWLALIGVGLRILKIAWDENWFGIQDTTKQVWEGNVKPAFVDLKEWLETHLPSATTAAKGALGDVGDVLSTILEPYILAVKNAIQDFLVPAWESLQRIIADFVIPVQERLAAIFIDGVGKAIAYVWGWINNMFLPVIKTLWSFITNLIVPIFEAWVDVVSAIGGLIMRFVLGIIERYLMPALTSIWEYVDQNLIQKLVELRDDALAGVMSAFEWFATNILPGVESAIGKVRSLLQPFLDLLHDFADTIRNMELPWWLQPGSPPPLYYALTDIQKAMDSMTNSSIPRFGRSMMGLNRAQMAYGAVSSRQVNVHMGGVEVNTPLDMATLKQTVINWVGEAIDG